MRKRLGRATKVAGIPLTKETAESLTRATRDFLGNNRVGLGERERRYGICLICPERRGARCSKCGCFLKTKTIFANSECPLGKWDLPLKRKTAVDDAGNAEGDEERPDEPR